MKELKKRIRELLYQKLSSYGFEKKKQWFLNRTVKDGNVIQTIAPGFSHGKKHILDTNIFVGVIYKNINEVAMELGEPDCMEYCRQKNFYLQRFSMGIPA